eukprot:scaffold248318_cov80-Cyclotella_meneghiniana.AAC.2
MSPYLWYSFYEDNEPQDKSRKGKIGETLNYAMGTAKHLLSALFTSLPPAQSATATENRESD